MKFLTMIAMVLISFNASADYFKGGLGYNMGGEVKFDSTGSSAKSDLDNTFMSPLLLAYGFEMMGDVHGEIELAYRQHKYDPSVSAEPTFLTVGYNVVGNVPMGGVTLTGGAGAFYGQFDSDSILGKGTGFGLQLFGGLDFVLNETVTLGGEFRYMTTVADIGLDNNVDASYNSMALMFNVKFGM
ncbi:porin family protein [bacterium]|nr:porin family protein [bacterium]